MAGYGNADDHIEAQQNHVDDSLALHRLKTSSGNTNPTGVCLECGDAIALERLKAVPNADHCIGCQEYVDKQENLHRKFQVKNHYMP